MRFLGVLLAFHSFHYRVHTRVFLTLLVLFAVTTLALAEPPPRELVQAAVAALRADDLGAARTSLERARQLAPDPATMPDLGLGQVAGEAFTFVTDSGWARFADPAHPPAPRTVIVRTLHLAAPSAP